MRFEAFSFSLGNHGAGRLFRSAFAREHAKVASLRNGRAASNQVGRSWVELGWFGAWGWQPPVQILMLLFPHETGNPQQNCPYRCSYGVAGRLASGRCGTGPSLSQAGKGGPVTRLVHAGQRIDGNR